jgi:hypothetical protein
MSDQCGRGQSQGETARLPGRARIEEMPAMHTRMDIPPVDEMISHDRTLCTHRAARTGPDGTSPDESEGAAAADPERHIIRGDD